MKSLARAAVLAGVAALAFAPGSAPAPANRLHAAEAAKVAPANLAVTANNDFAADLYRELAREHAGKDLFFSPYSMSSALAMTAEGARGETAEQMGKVLRFPAGARNAGADAARLPWDLAPIHSGLAGLNERFNARKPVPPSTRDRIEALRKELSAANARAADLQKARKWPEAEGAARQSQKLAGELNKQLAQVDQYELRVANALWGEKTYPFRRSYVDTVHKFYRTGGLFPVDFRTNHEAARQQINAWVEEQTRNRIKDLIPKKAVDEDTTLVLTNAIYFKGEWAEPFEAKATRDEDFFRAGGKKARARLMHNGHLGSASYAAFNADGSFFDTPRRAPLDRKPDLKALYPDEGGFAALEVPYKGEDLSMVVLLPRSADGLPDLEKKLTAANLQGWVGKLQRRTVDAYLPRFKLETNYGLVPTLKKLGMTRAFVDPRDPRGAQFDGMSASADPRNKLYITNVLHKAFVEVNEKGTEAAAATAVIMARPTSVPATRPFTPTFRADRPFVFLIRDRKSGTILFLGRMTGPTG